MKHFSAEFQILVIHERNLELHIGASQLLLQILIFSLLYRTIGKVIAVTGNPEE